MVVDLCGAPPSRDKVVPVPQDLALEEGDEAVELWREVVDLQQALQRARVEINPASE